MKKMLIAGNWKMNTNVFESEKLSEYIIGFLRSQADLKSEVLICPPFVSLYPLSLLVENSALKIGAQNCHYENKGAFTGEVSIEMLKHVEVSHVIIGHSERRIIFGEDDKLINKKLLALINAELTPILCIGETLSEREAGETYKVLENQLNICLDLVPSDVLEKLVIAYEPVWAIGTGVSATTEQANEAHDWIRKHLTEKYSDTGISTILLYGGSLNEKNAFEILSLPNVNGGLIGGASLKGDSFVSIIETAEKILHEA